MSAGASIQADPVAVMEALAEDLARLADYPLDFVMWAYPWTTDPLLQQIKLPEEYQEKYRSVYGPGVWQIRYLERLGELIRGRGFTGQGSVLPVQMARASGHGIGKSALTAWLRDFLQSTRPHSKGTITANTGTQLKTKTWAEVVKWGKRSVTAQLYEFGDTWIRERYHPETWRCDAVTCRKENSEAFAGQHAEGSTSWYLFDEASAVPDVIWEVSAGGLTSGEPFRLVFGNPTRNEGAFARAFTSERHRWDTEQIDSRNCELGEKTLFDQWIEDYGEDSDFVRVRVKGQFPRTSSWQLIGSDIVREAQERQAASYLEQPLIVGVDVARGGEAENVICGRRGYDARSYDLDYFRTDDVMVAVARIVKYVEAITARGQQVDQLFVDVVGIGSGVVDRLRQLGYPVIGVNSGERETVIRPDAHDKGAEMWLNLRDWLKEAGAIHNDAVLEGQLTSRQYGFDVANKYQLERKEDMVKHRQIESPDRADALAFTFAFPVHPKSLEGEEIDVGRMISEYRSVDKRMRARRGRRK